MFFEFKKHTKDKRVTFAKNVEICGFTGYARDILIPLCKDGTINKITAVSDPSVLSEGYIIDISKTEISIAYSDKRGLIYGALTVKQLFEQNELFIGNIEDAPDCAFRGYRCYLPGPSKKSIDEFYKMVDTIVYYKYNRISLEIGGAMEYKRHPEINRAWLEFAKEIHSKPGRAHEIQHANNWEKNSIHVDNGEGQVLTQDTVRQLIDYCRYRGLEVFPEVPTMSHSDYICLAHPELAERKEDNYPDTYCPNHPDTYKIVFDILDEITDVFRPDIVNIGHDELYTLCLCDRCKGLKPHEVFAKDVTTIHDYLKEKGIRTMMWGDKLLPVVTKDNKTYGGSPRDKYYPDGRHTEYPATYLCQMLIPKDVLILHWYFSFGMQYDLVYHTHGLEAVYGNMAADKTEHWRLRRELGMKGGMNSNWGSNNAEYMQRNNQFLHIIFGAYALWNSEYDSKDCAYVMKKTFEEAYRYHFKDVKSLITVEHSTDAKIKYKAFYDGVFIHDFDYTLGHYKVTYTDGTDVLFEVKYGTNITANDIPVAFDEASKFDPEMTLTENSLGEVCYSCIPFLKDGKTCYRTAFENPHPEKEVKSFEYIPKTDAALTIHSVKF